MKDLLLKFVKNPNVQLAAAVLVGLLVLYVVLQAMGVFDGGDGGGTGQEDMSDLQMVSDEEFQEASELMEPHETADGYDYESAPDDYDHDLVIANSQGEERGMYDMTMLQGASE